MTELYLVRHGQTEENAAHYPASATHMPGICHYRSELYQATSPYGIN